MREHVFTACWPSACVVTACMEYVSGFTLQLCYAEVLILHQKHDGLLCLQALS